MSISIEQAIEIHAKSALARAGHHAEKQTQERAMKCKERGDLDGYETWTKVAEGVRTLKNQGYRPSRMSR